MKLETILEKIKNRNFKNCIIKLKFDKKGMLIFTTKESKLDGRGAENENENTI